MELSLHMPAGHDGEQVNSRASIREFSNGRHGYFGTVTMKISLAHAVSRFKTN
jgi:hypothetical protein